MQFDVASSITHATRSGGKFGQLLALGGLIGYFVKGKSNSNDRKQYFNEVCNWHTLLLLDQSFIHFWQLFWSNAGYSWYLISKLGVYRRTYEYFEPHLNNTTTQQIQRNILTKTWIIRDKQQFSHPIYLLLLYKMVAQSAVGSWYKAILIMYSYSYLKSLKKRSRKIISGLRSALQKPTISSIGAILYVFQAFFKTFVSSPRQF